MSKGKPSQKQTEPDEPNKGGRPSAFKPEYVQQAQALCKLGATDAELADFFGVSVRTIYSWQSRYNEFLQALKAGKDEADDRVERSLYHRAIGYEYDAVKIFNAQGEPLIVPYREKCPPDTTAAIFWLKNRRKEKWRDVQQHEHGGVGDFDRMTEEELKQFILQEADTLRITHEPDKKSRRH